MENRKTLWTDLHKKAICGDALGVKKAIDSGIDINAKVEYDETALHLAMLEKSVEVVELLIKEGADVNIKDGDGETPLHWAARNRKDDFIKILVDAGADINATRDDGDTPLDLAFIRTHTFLAALGAKHSEEL